VQSIISVSHSGYDTREMDVEDISDTDFMTKMTNTIQQNIHSLQATRKKLQNLFSDFNARVIYL